MIGCFLLLMSGRMDAENVFQISVPDIISGYQSNPLTVTIPQAGKIFLEVRDETTLYWNQTFDVMKGKTQIIWDGLGWNEERLNRKNYRILAKLTCDSGEVFEAETGFTVGAAKQAVLFALPSDETAYLEETADWFLEFKLLYTDQLIVSFFRQDTGEMTLQVNRQAKGGRVNRLTLSTLLGKKRIEPGKYLVRVCGQQHPSYIKEFSLSVEHGKRAVSSLTVTGDIMPHRGDSDEIIWKKMMSPATVIDIQNVSHQRVYLAPDYHSKVLGTLHGQSQSLSVLEIQDNWVRISAWNHEKGAPVEGWVPKKILKVVQPQSRYGVLVDKKAQTLTLYENGKKIDTLLVSTGRMEIDEFYQETAAGSFLTDYHMSDYSTNGLKYDYVIRYDGGNLLHQIPYAWSESGKKDMKPGELYLGSKASHACIRIQEKPSEQGINAYWLWTHLPYHTRVIVLDDPEERTNLETILSGNTPDIEEGLKTSWVVENEEEDSEKTITITFGGDTVIGGRESYYGLAEGLPAYLEAKGYGWPFSSLQSIFEEDDLTCVNLECVLKDDASGEDLEKAWRFRGLTSYSNVLNQGSIDVVNVANNHTIDYGIEGYRSTLQALNENVEFCGNRINLILNIHGYLIGFAGCRETTYREYPEVIEEDIRFLRENGADFIIYQCHWGNEYEANHNALQEAMARTCQRAGADLVIGHHPHVVQGIDFINGMPVIYSLGNLMFGGTIKLNTYDAVLIQAKFYPDRDTDRIQLHMIPILTSSSSNLKKNDYQPCIATGEDALRILKKIQADTPFLLTERCTILY